MSCYPELHYKIINKLLRRRLCKCSVLKIALNVNIKEGAYPSERHRRSVLLLYSGEIREIRPLYRLSRVGGRTAYIVSVHCRHFLHITEKGYLLIKLLVKPYLLIKKILLRQSRLVLFLLLYKTVDSVKRHSSVIADYSAPAVSVRQSGNDMAVAGKAHLVGIRSENTVIMGRPVLELAFYLIAELIAVSLARLTRHSNSAERVYAPFERTVGLHSDNKLLVLIYIPGSIACKRGYSLCVYIKNPAVETLQLKKRIYPGHKLLGTL